MNKWYLTDFLFIKVPLIIVVLICGGLVAVWQVNIGLQKVHYQQTIELQQRTIQIYQGLLNSEFP